MAASGHGELIQKLNKTFQEKKMRYYLIPFLVFCLNGQVIGQDNAIFIQLSKIGEGIVPAEFIVEDELGKRTGGDPTTNTTFREIPNAHYGVEGLDDHESGGPGDTWAEFLWASPLKGTYTIKIIGSATDSINLNIQMARVGSQSAIFDFFGTTSPGQTIDYEIFYDPDTTVTLTAKLIKPIETVRDDLQDLIDADPGSPLADKLEDARDKLNSALSKLDANDVQGALGDIEGAVGDIQAAVDDGLLDAVTGNQFMDGLAGAARSLAVEAIDDAIARNGDPSKISDAQTALADGDVDRANLMFKDAVANYKDAVSQAEGA